MGRIIINKRDNGGYMFHIYAKNKIMVANSQVYTALDSCKNSVRSVMTNTPSIPVLDMTLREPPEVKGSRFEIYLDRANRYRFRFRSSNGRIVIVSHIGYSTKDTCKKSIESVRVNAYDAEVFFETAEGELKPVRLPVDTAGRVDQIPEPTDSEVLCEAEEEEFTPYEEQEAEQELASQPLPQDKAAATPKAEKAQPTGTCAGCSACTEAASAPQPEEKKKKRGFFARLFGRK